MDKTRADEPRIMGGRWSDCTFLDGRCLVDQIGEALGPQIMECLMRFILAPQAGARLSLQRNQSEFTSQVTGPVTRSAVSVASLSDSQPHQSKSAGNGRITPRQNRSLC
jgi:hypothetical protein